MDGKGFFVTGTGTGVGKTLVSLGLCLHFKADYWKPIQTGRPGDAEFVRSFLPEEKVYPGSYELAAPLSPNQAGEKENVQIDLKTIAQPKSPFLIVEGIGGVYVPLNDRDSVMDLIELIGFPVIVVAHSGLGTLNHSLLTLRALQNRSFKIAGVILSGEKNQNNKRDIEKFGKALVVLEIPSIPVITKPVLLDIFKHLKIVGLSNRDS